MVLSSAGQQDVSEGSDVPPCCLASRAYVYLAEMQHPTATVQCPGVVPAVAGMPWAVAVPAAAVANMRNTGHRATV